MGIKPTTLTPEPVSTVPQRQKSGGAEGWGGEGAWEHVRPERMPGAPRFFSGALLRRHAAALRGPGDGGALRAGHSARVMPPNRGGTRPRIADMPSGARMTFSSPRPAFFGRSPTGPNPMRGTSHGARPLAARAHGGPFLPAPPRAAAARRQSCPLNNSTKLPIDQ
ncbi:unnamed protein product, partial [Iphiclides podalirius]